MTTYCLNPNETWLAVYNLNTGTMPTNNVIFSHITANLSSSATSIAITSGEGELFTGGMIATIEQLNAEGKATAREVVLISAINGNTLTITRGYENCVIDDTASPKVLGNTPQSFTSGAKISVYVSRALLNGVQTRLSQVNCPCNTSVYNQSMELTNELDSCCDFWRGKLYDKLASNCGYRCCIFGNGSDGDLIVNSETADECGNYFLCANRVYQFNNLIIEEGFTVRFEKQGVPNIRVRNKFINHGVIDLRGGECTGNCCYVDDITGTTIQNLSYNRCPRKGGAGGINGADGTDSCGGDGGKVSDSQRTPAEGFNGGHGGCGPRGGNPPTQGGGGGGGGGRYGNGGDGGTGGCNTYQSGPNTAGDGGNSSYWGTGGNGGGPGHGYSGAGGQGGNGGNGFIQGGQGGCNSDYGAGTGGCGVLKGGKGGCGGYDAGGTAGRGGNAVSNMFGLFLSARIFDNTDGVICSKGGDGGEGGTGYRAGCDCRYTTNGGPGGNGADGGCSVIVYGTEIHQGTIDNSKGLKGLGGCPNDAYYDGRHCRVADGTDGNDGSCLICKVFNY